MRPVFLTLAALGLLQAAGPGDELFENKIRPLLVAKCYACHSGAVKEPMAGLRLDQRAGLSNTRILAAVSYQDAKLKMPPSGKLDAATLADFAAWAKMGSPVPADPEPGVTGQAHWAFRPVVKPTPPTALKNAKWPRSELDRFLLARMEAKGLQPAPDASKRVWIRRVTFDLIGLPPTMAEVDRFLQDDSAAAYENVVDTLLNSPHYGERWARHWLDLVRFAETNGHEFDNNKQDAWQYRDYVIRAFNQDLPYDRFVKEQIAGDLLPDPRLSLDKMQKESPIGTSIYWFGEVLNSATDSVKSRADQVDNQIDVLSKTFLGLTVACARCHDHKFDPIPTAAGYYAMAGMLHSTTMSETVVDSPYQRAEIANQLMVTDPIRAGRIDHFAARPGDTLFEDFTGTQFGSWRAAGQAFGTAPAQGVVNSGRTGALAAVGSLTSPEFKMPKLWVHVRMRGTKVEGPAKENLRVTVVADGHKSIHFHTTGKEGWEWRSGRMTKEIGRDCYIEIVDRALDGYLAVDKILISDNEEPPADDFSEEPWQMSPVKPAISHWAMVARDENPHNIRLHVRGSHQNLGDEVARGIPAILAGETRPPVPAHASGRLEFAGWTASPTNPLTARVMVNRIWQHHFGHGLVRTPDNFGKTGDRPSHPELLDWLAATFVESGWSVKKLHKQIVLSSAYRMASKPAAPAATAAADPRNDLLSFMPVRRLEGEAIRDAMLALSGRLNPQPYGPSVVPHISRYQDGRGRPAPGPLDGDGRRSIYIQVRRNFLTPMFLAFDYPLPISTIGARGTSTVPSQALMMMNNELAIALATRWGTNIAASGLPIDKAVERMYLEAFGRLPEEWETREALAFITRQPTPLNGVTELAQVLFNSAEFIYVQ